MPSSRLAAAWGFPSIFTAFLVSFSVGCAQSDAVEQPSMGATAGPGGGDGDGDGSAGSGGSAPAAASTTGDGGGEPSTSQASTGPGTGGAGGEGGSTNAGGGEGGSTSSGATCGDGVIDGDEACDGDALDGATCASVGFVGGTLGCDGSCALDTTGCSAVAACDNGVDDDDDGLVDDDDPGCTGTDDDDELVYAPTCDGAGTAVVDLTTVDGMSISYEGTTDAPGVVNNFTSTAGGGCTSAPGPEVALRFEVTSTIGTLVLTLDNPGTDADWDPVLYVRGATCTGTQIGCNNDGNGGVLASTLVLSNVQPGTYYIFVDGRTAGDAGAFEISLTPS